MFNFCSMRGLLVTKAQELAQDDSKPVPTVTNPEEGGRSSSTETGRDRLPALTLGTAKPLPPCC